MTHSDVIQRWQSLCRAGFALPFAFLAAGLAGHHPSKIFGWIAFWAALAIAYGLSEYWNLVNIGISSRKKEICQKIMVAMAVCMVAAVILFLWSAYWDWLAIWGNIHTVDSVQSV